MRDLICGVADDGCGGGGSGRGGYFDGGDDCLVMVVFTSFVPFFFPIPTRF